MKILSIILFFCNLLFGSNSVSQISLSSDEQEWLKKNHIVTIGVGNRPPFQMMKYGEFEGISIEYIKTIFKKYNIKYEFFSSRIISWKEASSSIRDKTGVDLILTVTKTTQRANNMLFTDNYISSPLVIFTQDDYGFISKIEDLYGKTVSVQNSYSMQKLLESEYPKIKLNIVNGSNATEDALKLVAVGKVDAFIGNLTIGSFISKRSHLDNIKVASPTKLGNHDNAMAIRDDWSPLVSIINKELKIINNSNKKDEIYNKYLSIKYEHGISFKDVLKWIGIVILIFSFIIIVIVSSNRNLTQEIERRKKLELEANEYILTIEKLTITDPLTNLYNRRYFNQVMEKEINKVKQRNDFLTLVMLDIDYFKQYNDMYGHYMGDEVLIKVSKLLRNTLQRADDYCFRLGGEEFGIVFMDLNESESLLLCEKFRKNIESMQIKHKGSSSSEFLTASFGLVCAKGNNIKDIDTMYKIADDMLYKAKKSGRNKIITNTFE